MSDQLDLFAPARATDPETSGLAAVHAIPNAGTNRHRALIELDRAADGLTDFDLERILKVKQTSIGKRRGELCDLGLAERRRIIDPVTGEIVNVRRPAPSGAWAAVWVITDAGRDALRTGEWQEAS